jgi:hypothetical protein
VPAEPESTSTEREIVVYLMTQNLPRPERTVVVIARVVGISSTSAQWLLDDLSRREPSPVRRDLDGDVREEQIWWSTPHAADFVDGLVDT